MSRRQRIWLAYKRYKEIIKIIAAIVGIVAGISACGLFAKKYHNYHAAGWAAFSAVCAVYFLHVVFSVRRDVERKIKPEAFIVYMVFGSLGLLTGLTVFITYLVIALDNHESVDPKGNYVVVVWGFMSFKWSLFGILSSRKYRKEYMSLDGENTGIVDA